MEQLYDPRGQRKYLTEPERNRFLKAARSTDTQIRAFCEVLAFTGCRVPEAPTLTPELIVACLSRGREWGVVASLRRG